MKNQDARRRALIIGVLGMAAAMGRAAAEPADLTSLAGHVPAALSRAAKTGVTQSDTPISLAVVLPPRNSALLQTTLQQIYDPARPSYHHFLTTQQFNEQFAPTEADYAAVAAYLKSQGLTVSATHPNRMVLDVSGPASAMANAFHVTFDNYQAADGRLFYSPSAAPSLPAAIAGRILSVVGLDNAAVLKTHNVQRPTANGFALPHADGGPSDGLTPGDINAAYNLNGSARTGSGQSIALFELDGYTASDIQMYAAAFGLPNVTLQNVLLDGAAGAPSKDGGAAEVTLDIELALAAAPGASKILVYEAPNTSRGLIDAYNKIATDNLAHQVSSSWGLAESQSSPSLMNAENAIFQQMALQGQSVYAAAGDSGAYDDGSTVSVDDPASQPCVTGVGGTRLTTTNSGAYQSETTWNQGAGNGAGGGGVSAVWPKPTWQQGVGQSTTKRNVPDVSLNSDPNTGYAIAYQGVWTVFGGTSCAAPLWAGYTALVNEQRAAANQTPLGFANPALYALGAGTHDDADFHDIADGSTNLYFTATPGYDNATGWGSFNGLNLLADLSADTPTDTAPAAPAAPAKLTAVSAGAARIALSWTESAHATLYTVLRSTMSGGPYTAIGSGKATNWKNDGLKPGTTYYYVVTATNLGGTSAYSPEASAAATAETPKTPTDFAAKGQSATSIGLSWNPSAGATSYEIFRSATKDGAFVSLGVITPAANSTARLTSTDTGLTANTAYYYVIDAISAAGVSPKSAPIEASTLATAPGAPSNLAAKVVDGKRIALTWTAGDGAMGYVIQRSKTAGGPYQKIGTSTATTYTNGDGLAPSTTYYYVVSSVNSAGSSANSNEASAATASAPPSAPEHLTATIAVGGGVTLTWRASLNATGYKIGRRLGRSGAYTNLGTATSLTYTDTSTTPGTTYSYVVAATNSTGTSAPSLDAIVTILPSAPPAPQSLTATASGAHRIALTWAEAPGATSYVVLRSKTTGGPYLPVATTRAAKLTNDGLTANTAYYYVVKAANLGGLSAASSEAAATTAKETTDISSTHH